jgi:hypothetical protein
MLQDIPNNPKQKRSFRKKTKLAATAIGLSVMCCGVIYGCCVYESLKYLVFGSYKKKYN